MHTAMDRFWILPLLALMTLARFTDSLSCYQCESPESAQNGNLECLKRSQEVTCSNGEDRCHTLHDFRTIQKGCIRSSDCGTRHTCCDRDFCNAGGVQGQVYKTGVGKPCKDITECVQTEDNMRCVRKSQEDRSNQCTCGMGTYREAAVCISKSELGGACENDKACKTTNAECKNGSCQCKMHFFEAFNDYPSCMSKRNLGQVCSDNKQCKDDNGDCVNNHCECKLGYKTENMDCVKVGSGSGRVDAQFVLIAAIAIATRLFL